MKKMTLALSAMIASASLYAATPDRVSDMKELSNGMGFIMNGLLYDNVVDIKNGTQKIQSTIKHIQSQDLKQYLPKDTAYAYKFAEKSLRRITEYSNEVDEAMRANDYEGAFESSVLLMRQCNSCHSRVRGW